MEKLSTIPGIVVTGNKSLDIVHAKHELEKKKKLYHSVNLSKLPDNGARIKNQIDELETILQSLSLENLDGNEDRCNGPLSRHKENVTKDQVYKNKESSKENKSNNTDTSINNKDDKSIKNETNYRKDDRSSIKETSENREPKESEKKYLSFSDLTPKQTVKHDSKQTMDSPSFKTWREPGNPRKALLTEAKPLVEKPVLKNSSQFYPFLSNPFLQTNDECAKKMHNVLETFPDDSKEESDPENLKSSLMLHQKKGLTWVMWREKQDPSGGILADDMGLGKTVVMISLILKQKERNDYSSFNEEKFECRGTLIVCVASIIHQWRDEIKKHCEDKALTVYLYHGPQREKNIKHLMKFDVVLTTYNIVMSEGKSMDRSPLFNMKWERIILDEAHTIKNYNSQTAQAIFNLKAFRKWAVTGTPIHNVFKDIYSLVKFLGFSPFDDYKKFKALTDDKSESSEKRRQLLIKSIVLRRTKQEVDEFGKPLIEMKKKSFKLYSIELSAKERQIYNKLEEKITRKLYQFLQRQSKSSNGSSLLVLLLRLQQCCNHLCLIKEEAEVDVDSYDITDNMSALTINETESDSNSSSSTLNLTMSEIDTEELTDRSVQSSKIKELFNKLHAISESSENKDKSVIVSQWVSMLDIVAYHLREENIPYHMIIGSTKVEDRQKFAEDFNTNDDGVKIMLLSLKAGGVGLNLIGANHLFLLDLHWNPALEMQACDRIHRVGQKKDVIIHKFICKNTIEEKIKTLQDMKSGIADSALRGTKQNTRGLTVEDFKLLFSIKK